MQLVFKHQLVASKNNIPFGGNMEASKKYKIKEQCHSKMKKEDMKYDYNEKPMAHVKRGFIEFDSLVPNQMKKDSKK